MTTDTLLINEIFHSIQGESSLAGLRFAFIRLTGCNLRCAYCDTTYAFHGGEKMRVAEIIEKVAPFRVKNVLITGGEPLLQKNVTELVEALNRAHYEVSIETHGEISVAPVAGKAKLIMDIKTPGSGMCREGFRENLPLLKPTDEVKFVITSQDDYAWAKEIVLGVTIPAREILFSPVIGPTSDFDAQWLAEKIIEDHLNVRFQLQLHKFIWGPDRKGV